MAAFWDEAETIFPLHWREIALDQAEVPLGVDRAHYAMLEEKGFFKVLTARAGSKLVGYFFACGVDHHPHYKDAGPMATTDMFYLLPSHRRGGAGARMILAQERAWREQGVRKAFISTKLHQEHDALMKALGWRPSDTVYTKLL